MKKWVILASTLCFFLGNKHSIAEEGPAFALSPEVLSSFVGFGVPSTTTYTLNCTTILSKQWAYPTGQVTAVCHDAETSCLRYTLMKEQLEKKPTANLKQYFALTTQEAERYLYGCVLAIETAIKGGSLLYQGKKW